jgi:hypothetical protein
MASGIARHGTALYGTTLYGTALYGTARYAAAAASSYNSMHGTARHCTAFARHCTAFARHCTARHGIAGHCKELYGMAWHGTPRHRKRSSVHHRRLRLPASALGRGRSLKQPSMLGTMLPCHSRALDQASCCHTRTIGMPLRNSDSMSRTFNRGTEKGSRSTLGCTRCMHRSGNGNGPSGIQQRLSFPDCNCLLRSRRYRVDQAGCLVARQVHDCRRILW